MRQIAMLVLVLLLAGCVVPATGSQVVEIDYQCDEVTGECTTVSRLYSTPTPMPTGTPYPMTTGYISLGETWDAYLDSDTEITWTMTQRAGPAHLTINHRDVYFAAYVPGEYVLVAEWTYNGQLYNTNPFTVTIVAE